MLALSRKKNEAIVINNNIEITILEIKGDQVKLGVSAPKEVPIYRKEVYVQIQDANKEATNIEGMEALKNLLGQKETVYTDGKSSRKKGTFFFFTLNVWRKQADNMNEISVSGHYSN